jgi:hypothetical protein
MGLWRCLKPEENETWLLPETIAAAI